MKKFLLITLLLTSLWADDLTIDPPLIWDTPCEQAPCPPCFLPPEAATDEVTVHLNNPTYEDGVLTTFEGGILRGPDIRIQAQTIIYTRRPDAEIPVTSVYCEGNLLVDYQGEVFVGEALFYDFLTHSGTIRRGKSASPPWYIGGEEIMLLPNGDVSVLDGYLTTSEGGERDVVLKSSSLYYTCERVLTIHNAKFCINGVPLLWLPRIRLSLDDLGDLPFAITFKWGGYPGTQLGIRYKFIDWRDFKAYARLDAFFGQGMGGGIETAYVPSNSYLEWFSRNYFASDIAIFDPERKTRYRFQGTLWDLIWQETTSLSLQYDLVSDGEMAANYTTDDFEMNTAGNTRLELHRREESWIANLLTTVKVNSFQTINQELPTLFWQLHPFETFAGVIADNFCKISYLDYNFGNETLAKQNFRSGRFEVHPHLYKPFYLGPATLTPEATFVGIAYSDGPQGRAVGQAVGDLGASLETALSRCFYDVKHVVEPYAHYHFLTHPRASLPHHYLFTIQDAYAYEQIVRFGVRNGFFSKGECGIERFFWIDLWANAFLNTPTVPPSIQKAYYNIEWTPFSRIFVESDGGWNFQNRELDFSNTRIHYTFSENLAAGVEYRHRSSFAWRKADFYNFLLESVYTEDELLPSALSDRRDTLLARIFYRIHPDWMTRFEVRHGWNRKRVNNQPMMYTEYEIDVGTAIFGHWRLHFNYESREADKRFSFSFKLDPSPPGKNVSGFGF